MSTVILKETETEGLTLGDDFVGRYQIWVHGIDTAQSGEVTLEGKAVASESWAATECFWDADGPMNTYFTRRAMYRLKVTSGAAGPRGYIEKLPE